MAARQDAHAPDKPKRHNRLNLAQLAYERCEEAIVTCRLRPGRSLSMQDLQSELDVGRTPIHQAVNRLASDTLIVVRPRHGLQIAPIDLGRERILLRLRREMERFVLRLAAERCGPSHRNQFLHLGRALRSMATPDIVVFNQLDRRIDLLLLQSSCEPFLEHTLRPLHTIFRRLGWIFHNWVRPDQGLARTVACHVAIIDAVCARDADAAAAAADQLIEWVEDMFMVMDQGIDPALLDCSLGVLAAD